MTILSGETIRSLAIISPHVSPGVFGGMSYGESLAGYDIRVAKTVRVFVFFTSLAVSLERFDIPTNVCGGLHDKSTWARRGLSVFNTILEPGWRGWLTVEMTYKPRLRHFWKLWITIPKGTPIGQVVFERVDKNTSGYNGKYQDQPQKPIDAIF